MMYLSITVMVALAIKMTSADLDHECLPDGTVQVINPNVGLYSHVFAVQDEGVSAAVKCSVSTSGAQSNITGCSQDNAIVVWFSNRAGSVDTFAGTSAISYEVQCNDLPSEGVDKTVVNNLAANIEVTTQDIVTPSFVVSSELRTVNQLGSSASSATVGDTLYWTIDIPAEYSAKMDCTAYSGPSISGSPNKFLVDDGCEQDSNLMGSDFDNEESGVPGIKRYWAVLYVFKFYNSNDIFFSCTVTVCPSGSSSCDISCSKRKRSAGARQLTGPDDKVFSTSQMLHILPGANSATTMLGTFMHRFEHSTTKTKFPQAYNIQRQQAAGRMPVLTRDHLALKLRQNWMAKYPMDTCSNGGSNLDDSLTSLNWLQNLNILKITSPTPPSSPIPPFDSFKNVKVNPNSILNVACGPPPTKFPDMRFPYADTPPLTPNPLGSDSVDYKTNPYVKPPYSYATLICMAMKETKKSKITLSAIYNWITDNFMYYRLADPSWQNSIRHNLSLNKCFQKVPRRKDEPGKGGFWRINPEYTDMVENGVFKKRRNSRDGQSGSNCNSNSGSPLPLKKIKREPLDDDYPDSCSQANKLRKLNGGNGLLSYGAQEEYQSLKGDFNWTSILNQDIDIGGVKVKTEALIDHSNDDVASPIMAMSPPSSDTSGSDFGISDLLDTDFSDIPLDCTTNNNLDLTVVGTSIRAPGWWDESFNFGEHKGLLQNIENLQEQRSGLHTPIAPSPVHEVEHDHPWLERNDFNLDSAFDVDNLFDIENIPSPHL